LAATLVEIDGIVIEREETPASLQELSEIMRQSWQAGTPVVPTGGGTKLTLGNPLRSAGMVLRLSRLSGIIEYEPDNMTVSVRAGTSLHELQSALSRANQFLPLDPPHSDRATAAGLVACNTSGPIRLRYGTLRDMLIGVRVVHADGSATKAGGKLVKNVTGYDMCKLYTGSLGTLGILSELTFKVWPKPEVLSTIIIVRESFEEALETTQAILRSGLLPDAVEAWNASAFQRLTGEDIGSAWAVMVRFGDIRRAVEWQVGRIGEIIPSGAGRVHVLEEGESESFWHKAASAREQSEGVEDARIKCSVLSQSAAGTVRRMEAMAEKLGARASLFCHAATNVVYGHYAWQSSVPDTETLLREFASLRSHCAGVGGHMVVEKVKPEVKRGFDVWGYEAKALAVMRQIKQQFDPKGLLNPGRFVGGI
jgi:glycolate oxidase FAD binding subunit